MFAALTERWRAAERRLLSRFLPLQETGRGVALTQPWDDSVDYEVDGRKVSGLEYNDAMARHPDRCTIRRHNRH